MDRNLEKRIKGIPVSEIATTILKQVEQQEIHGLKGIDRHGNRTYEVNYPGFGLENCTLIKEQRAKEQMVKKKRTKADEEIMIQQSFMRAG